MTSPHCPFHRSRVAAWTCPACSRDLCCLCAVPDPDHPSDVLCSHCANLAEPLLTSAEVPANWRMLPTFALSILSPRGLFLIVALSGIMILLGFVPVLGGLLGIGIFAGYYFLTIRSAMDGEHRLPTPTFDNVFDDVFLPAIRFVIPSLMLAVPFVVYVVLKLRDADVTESSQIVFDPVLLIGILGAFLLFPALLIVAAISSGVFSVLNPMHVLSFVLRIPGAYLVTFVLWLLTHFVGGVVVFGVGLLSFMAGQPFVAFLVEQTVNMAAALYTALLFGWLIHANRERLGLDPVGARVPVTPDEPPRGRLRVQKTREVLTQDIDPIRWPGLPADAAEQVRRPRPDASEPDWSTPNEQSPRADRPALTRQPNWSALSGESPLADGPTAAGPQPEPWASKPTAAGPGKPPPKPVPWEPAPPGAELGPLPPGDPPPRPGTGPLPTARPAEPIPEDSGGWLRPLTGPNDSLLDSSFSPQPVLSDLEDDL
jgi:hypothetical protein